MPIPVSFSARDLLRGTLVNPGWYRVRIESVGQEPSKDGGSTNYPVEGTIVAAYDAEGEKFIGVPITWNFNSKAMGFAKGFFQALGVELKADERVDLQAAEGMDLDVMIENGEWQGRILNRVNHKYRVPR